MGKVVASAAMSLDGFMADSRGSVERLYPDLDALRRTDVLQECVRRTGAVLMGRRTYAMGDPDSYLGDYEYQVPIFVVTHEVPERQPKQGGKLTFTFVTDGIRSAVRQARAVSGEKSVTVVGGASTLQQCLRGGLVDELHLDIIPVLFGDGLRLFGSMGFDPVELKPVRVLEYLGRIHLEFAVGK